MSNNRQGDYMNDIEARLRERTLAQPMSSSCALCTWSASGTAGEVLEAARVHRKDEHGITRPHRRRPTRGLNTFRSPGLSDEDRQEIAREIARRKRLNGVEV